MTFDGEHYTVRGESLPTPPPVPILIGGNSRAVHAAGAAYADILGLIGFSSSGGGGGSDFSMAAAERQVARLRELAGLRFPQLEVHALVQWHELTDDRRAAAERAAPQLEVPVDIVLDSPYVLLGTPGEIADQLRSDHRRLGITRWTIFGDRPDLQPAQTLVPVLELLGTPRGP